MKENVPDRMPDLAKRDELKKRRKFWLAMCLVSIPLAYYASDEPARADVKYVFEFLVYAAASLLFPFLLVGIVWFPLVVRRRRGGDFSPIGYMRVAYAICYVLWILGARYGSGRRLL